MSVEGIVRTARRPAEWRAPGPLPRTPEHRPDLWPASGEDLCFLTGDWRILQRVHGHRWSLDDLVTAAVAADALEVVPQRIADLGCGIGAVLLMLAWRFPLARLVGIEAQVESAALARRSIAWNGAEVRCEVRDGDLRDPGPLAGEARFELITGTPPYFPPGTGREPTRSLQAACHMEQRGGIEAYCATAVSLLARDGRFVVCHPSVERSERAARTAGLAIVARLDVIPRDGKRPLFSVFTMSARPNQVETAVTRLVVRDVDGQWTNPFCSLRRLMGMPAE